MNLPYFIAGRIARNRRSSFSRFITRLATVATTLSVAVMIVSVALVNGFKTTIEQKMFVFWGHFHVVPFNANPASIITPNPIDFDPVLAQQVKTVPGVVAVYPFAIKPAILNAAGTIEGVKLKGVGPEYPLQSNNSISFTGKPISFSENDYSKDIILSTPTAARLGVKAGDSLLVYFVEPGQDFFRIRKLHVAGLYKTGVEEVDKSFALCDLRLIRRISNWKEGAINGYQVAVNDYRQASAIADITKKKYLVPPITRETIEDIYPNIFSWLEAQNINTRVLLIIMALVAVINIATALLIFILERTNMIGILKAMGMTQGRIQRIFIFHSLWVSLRGIVLGTALGVGLCALQYYTHLMPMNEETYSVRYAPININAWQVLIIDAGTFLFCILIMLLPSLMTRSISVVKAIRFK